MIAAVRSALGSGRSVLSRWSPRSLFGRLVAAIALWTALSLALAALVLTQIIRADAEAGFRSLLTAHSYNVMGALERDGEGRLSGAPDLRDPRFGRPLSGWYWFAGDAQTRMRSASLRGERLRLPVDLPFDASFRRTAVLRDAADNRVLALETRLLVDDDERPVTILVAGNMQDVERQVADFRRTLVLFFLLFGLGLVAAAALIVRFGLRPLDAAVEALAAVRAGERERIEGRQPREVQPLVDEVNALLVSNRDVVERSRRQVGNLAHGLKTPLAVLGNEVATADTPLARTVREQVRAMREQIDLYLDRARIAALRNTARARTPVAPIVDDLVRTVRRLSPEIDIKNAPIEPDLLFEGDRSDLTEVLGNLLENAARFAASCVAVSAEARDGALWVCVEDDGPGLSDAEAQAALGRGVRLDERRSGSGLGLSIVHDIVEAYDGELSLDASSLGGLRVRARLPYAARTR